MNTYQINIFSINGSRGSNDLSCVVKSETLKSAKELAKTIIEENINKYDSIKLKNVIKLKYN